LSFSSGVKLEGGPRTEKRKRRWPKTTNIAAQPGMKTESVPRVDIRGKVFRELQLPPKHQTTS